MLSADICPRHNEGVELLPVPTLLIAGETDCYVSLEQLLEMRHSIPRSEMLILNHAGMDPDANHLVQHTRAEVVGPVIFEFLTRHGDAAVPT